MRNGARKTFAWLLVSILITTCRAQSVPGPTCGGQFDFQPWLEDFGQLTAEMADVLFTGGILLYVPPGSFKPLESKTTLFHPLRYSHSESTEQPPLYVLVERETWSAAEYFAAILQDNKAATIVGELTGGAGCGYTNGGIPAELRHSHVVVKMPDCVRLRKDGSDEVNGVIPDILVPWAQRDTPYTKDVKLSHALNAALAAESSKPLSHEEWEFQSDQNDEAHQ